MQEIVGTLIQLNAIVYDLHDEEGKAAWLYVSKDEMYRLVLDEGSSAARAVEMLDGAVVRVCGELKQDMLAVDSIEKI